MIHPVYDWICISGIIKADKQTSKQNQLRSYSTLILAYWIVFRVPCLVHAVIIGHMKKWRFQQQKYVSIPWSGTNMCSSDYFCLLIHEASQICNMQILCASVDIMQLTSPPPAGLQWKWIYSVTDLVKVYLIFLT